jgi:hypothetical protein
MAVNFSVASGRLGRSTLGAHLIIYAKLQNKYEKQAFVMKKMMGETKKNGWTGERTGARRETERHLLWRERMLMAGRMNVDCATKER